MKDRSTSLNPDTEKKGKESGPAGSDRNKKQVTNVYIMDSW